MYLRVAGGVSSSSTMESRGTWLATVIPTREFALYSLGSSTPAANGNCRLPFSSARYSRYKYGSVVAAETLARALGAAFCAAHPELALAPRLLMASSPYAHVPSAATTLARRLQPVLNTARAKNGLAPVPLLRVDRISTSAGDYGTLSAQARDLHMAANILSFRRFRPGKTRSTTRLLRHSMTWPESWKAETSPGTSACASSLSARRIRASCRGSCTACPTGSSATWTATAAETATRGWGPMPRAMPLFARN
jgi:hypothetical protein